MDELDIWLTGRIEANRKKGSQVTSIFASFERKSFLNSLIKKYFGRAKL